MRAETLEALSVLGVVFSDTVSTEQLKAYAVLLSDIQPEILKKAVLGVCQRAKFPPRPADIREEAEKIYNMAAGVKPPDAGASWLKVKKGLSRWGSYRKEDFLAELEKEGDTLTAEAVRRFDFEGFGRSPEADVGNWEARYKRIYNGLAARFDEEKRIRPLLADGKVQRALGASYKTKPDELKSVDNAETANSLIEATAQSLAFSDIG